MGKILYILNAFYPINPGETFLANEIDYLKGFDSVFVCPIFAQTEKLLFEYATPREVKPEIVSIAPYTKTEKIMSVIKALCNKHLEKECEMLLKRGKTSKTDYIKAFKFVAHCLHLTDSIWKHMKDHVSKEDEVVLYSYWLNHDAFVASLLKERLLEQRVKASFIARGHRVDIYEYANNNYIPMRQSIFENADLLCPISEDGKKYLINNYNLDIGKVSVQRLGTADHGVNITPRGKKLRIVSCSWMRKVKRLDLLVQALSCAEFPIEWTHYGTGEEYEHIVRLSKEINNPQLKCMIMGATPNEKVIEDLGKMHYDVFINVSSSEGIPVSIMEAMSFGKPIIATNVGGSNEIVHDGVNGYLLDKDCDATTIMVKLSDIYYATDDSYNNMCWSSRHIWEKMCAADINYKTFDNVLISL